MTSVTVPLSESLLHDIERRAAAAGFGAAGEFLRDLAERELRRDGQRERLEVLLLEGLDSGKSEEADDAWWAERHAELDRRIAQES
jgi:antitoxin ParD1/3/4